MIEVFKWMIEVFKWMIEVFKWIKGFNKGDINKVLLVSTSNRTRSNGYKLEKFRFREEIGKNWFTNRVLDVLICFDQFITPKGDKLNVQPSIKNIYM